MRKPKPSRKSKWEYVVTALYRGIETETLEARVGQEVDGHGFLFVDGTHDAEWRFKKCKSALRAFDVLKRCHKVTSVGLERQKA